MFIYSKIKSPLRTPAVHPSTTLYSGITHSSSVSPLTEYDKANMLTMKQNSSFIYK